MSDGSRENQAVVAARRDPQPNTPLLSELYSCYRTELVTLVRGIIGNGPPEPEDVVQQTFCNYVAQASTQTIANPRAFLRRTAHNIAINDRKRARIARRFFEPAPPAAEIREARTDWDPEVVLSSKEACKLIEDAIRAMPEQRRRFLLLNRVEGLSYAEIGRVAGVSECTVRKQVAHAVRECGAVLLDAENPQRTVVSER